MATYNQHITQAKSNATFLEQTNAACGSAFWDWQTTICFYIGVHLINAHIAKVANQHYRRHDVVSNAINPRSSLATCPVPQTVYQAYVNLQMLSRRSRYLISDMQADQTIDAQYTTEIYFSRAVRNLDKIMNWTNATYSCGLPTISLDCSLLQSSTGLKMFTIKPPVA